MVTFVIAIKRFGHFNFVLFVPFYGHIMFRIFGFLSFDIVSDFCHLSSAL